LNWSPRERGLFFAPDPTSKGEKGSGVALWERLLAGPIAPQATSTRRKDAFSIPAVEQVVSALGLIGVRLGGGKGAHLASRQQAAALGVDAR
jgi:hypothetical protein